MASSIWNRPFDAFICLFYGIQVPMAILMDSQAIFPVDWYPKFTVDMNRWYIEHYGDPLVAEKPGWFRGCIYFELFVQLPFWMIATYAYAANKQWIRLPGLIFSLCSLSVMVPIFSELLLSSKHFDRVGVLQIYAMFVIAPLLIAVKTLAFDDIHPIHRKAA